jgi:hypothetical protein
MRKLIDKLQNLLQMDYRVVTPSKTGNWQHRRCASNHAAKKCLIISQPLFLDIRCDPANVTDKSLSQWLGAGAAAPGAIALPSVGGFTEGGGVPPPPSHGALLPSACLPSPRAGPLEKVYEPQNPDPDIPERHDAQQLARSMHSLSAFANMDAQKAR